MYKSFYAGTDLAFLPQLALLLFLAVFVAAFVRLFVLKKSADFEAFEALPFSDEETR